MTPNPTTATGDDPGEGRPVGRVRMTWREAYLYVGQWGTPTQQIEWMEGEIARLEAQPNFDPDTSPSSGWVKWATPRATQLRAALAAEPGTPDPDTPAGP